MKDGDHDPRDVDLVDEVTEQLEQLEPLVRVDLVQKARARIADGDHPSALDVAGTVVAHFA